LVTIATSNDTTLTKVEYNSTHSIIYSKAMDSLPIIGTHVGGIPCLDPVQSSVQTTNTYGYQGDFTGLNAGCIGQPNGFSFDFRYTNIGFAISEYDLRESNGINKIYNYFANVGAGSLSDSIAVKRNSYDFWTR